MPIFARSARPGVSPAAAALALGVACALASACSSEEDKPAAGEDEGDGDATGKRDAGTGAARDSGGGTSGGKNDAGRVSQSDAGGSTAGGGTGSGADNTCAKVELKTTRVIPTVWLMIDGSGSMSSALNGLAGTSRWGVLRDALLAEPDGLVARLQGSVDFGLFVYDGGLSPPGVKTDACPRLVEVAPALNNYTALSAAYPAAPLGASTPTHYALESLSMRIAAAGQSTQSPTYVVLATDGKPNLCDFHDGIPASAATDQEAVATVSKLADMGTKLFAISLAGGDPELEAHLNDLASAGSTGKPAFSPTTQDALVDTLSEIIGGTTSCDITVDGSIVDGRECAGEVLLNGKPLVCNGPDGFRIAADHQTLQLQGAACDALRGQPTSELNATFACADVIVI